MDLVGVLEGLLFVVGDEGITLKEICDILKVTEKEGMELLTKLKEEYEKQERGIRISFLGESFKLTTKKEYKDYYSSLVDTKIENLSQANLEVLAIIAYNEPITRVEVDNIRGIASSYIIRKLLSLDLIKVCGKSDLPGKPNMYKTTREFLDFFGLASLNDLPDITSEENKDENIELFKSSYKENK